MSNHSVIEHRANYHYVKLEEDYILICSQGKQYPHCKAMILTVLEHWMNDKKAKGQDEYIYMTYPQWVEAMYGLFRRNHIIACLAELEQEKLIIKRPYRYQGKDSYAYILNVQVVQDQLKALTERTEKYTRPNLHASKFTRVQKQTGVNLDGSTDLNLDGTEHEDASKFTPFLDSITEIPSDIDSNACETFDTETQSQEVDDEDTIEMEAVKPPSQQNTPAPVPPVQAPEALTPAASAQTADSPSRSTSTGSAQGRAGLRVVHAPVTQVVTQAKLPDPPPVMAMTEKQIRKQQERRIDEIFTLFGALIDDKPTRSRENKNGAKMLAQEDRTDEDITLTIKAILEDKYFGPRINLEMVHSQLNGRKRENKQHNGNGKPPDTITPPREDFTGKGKILRLARLQQQQQALGGRP